MYVHIKLPVQRKFSTTKIIKYSTVKHTREQTSIGKTKFDPRCIKDGCHSGYRDTRGPDTQHRYHKKKHSYLIKQDLTRT